jgi:hypothetical protein
LFGVGKQLTVAHCTDEASNFFNVVDATFGVFQNVGINAMQQHGAQFFGGVNATDLHHDGPKGRPHSFVFVPHQHRAKGVEDAHFVRTDRPRPGFQHGQHRFGAFQQGTNDLRFVEKRLKKTLIPYV